jgi:transglutaminase-like putative cysteine protease
MRRFLLIFLFIPLFFSACTEEAPVIAYIDPRIGILGEALSIYGENFGAEQNESYITIAGAQPTLSSYVRWEDNRIIVTISEFAEPGLIYVYRGNRKSNPVLFASQASIPEIVKSDEFSNAPQINNIEPRSASVGSLISIQGSNFGSSRDSGGVWFAWDSESAPSMPAERRLQEMAEIFDTELGYELWNDREIRVRVPDGAVSGNLEVRTSRGDSRPFFFEIAGKPGVKTFKDKRSYTLSYTVDIRVEEASSPNALYLWIPKPVSSASQRNTSLLSRNADPYVDNYRGTTLYQFIDLPPGSSRQITLSYVMDVYSVETVIQTQNVRQDMNSPVQMIHTMPSALIPSDHDAVKAQSAAIVGRERNPYLKARLIYDWLIRNGGIQSDALGGGVLEALEEGAADSYRTSLLFCALARAAEIPAIPVAGVLITRNLRTVRHYWAEFWIDSYGWIPVDPFMGAGAASPDFITRDDRASYYFGNSDNQRIAFSRGHSDLAQMDPRGRIVGRPREFALQNLWEEAVGGLESYSSLWSNVTITGMYSQ